ncbi:MAG: hypothetical protein IJ060_05020 [Oscillospiraceae bacterium]|nr:hypothetical protein [Oscillospiraceae bacterium]
MTKKLQADVPPSRHAGVVRCCLNSRKIKSFWSSFCQKARGVEGQRPSSPVATGEIPLSFSPRKGSPAKNNRRMFFAGRGRLKEASPCGLLRNPRRNNQNQNDPEISI